MRAGAAYRLLRYSSMACCPKQAAPFNGADILNNHDPNLSAITDTSGLRSQSRPRFIRSRICTFRADCPMRIFSG
jgi:hypothetical protein